MRTSQKDKPGIGGKIFHLRMDANWFRKGDIISTGGGIKAKVIKIYKLNLWRRFLLLLNEQYDLKIKVRLLEIKCETIE